MFKVIKKSKNLLGIISLILGVLSMPLLVNEFLRFVLIAGAFTFYFLQRRTQITKPAVVGFVAGLIGLYKQSWFFHGQRVYLFLMLAILALVYLSIKFHFIQRTLKWLHKHKKHANLVKVVAVVGLILLIVVVVRSLGPTRCATKECFVAKAKYCNEAVLTIEEPIGTVKYEAKYERYGPIDRTCNLTKMIVDLHPDEDPIVVAMLKGKSTTCYYGVGNVNSAWVYSLVSGLDQCSEYGGLKEAMGNLILFIE